MAFTLTLATLFFRKKWQLLLPLTLIMLVFLSIYLVNKETQNFDFVVKIFLQKSTIDSGIFILWFSLQLDNRKSSQKKWNERANNSKDWNMIIRTGVNFIKVLLAPLAQVDLCLQHKNLAYFLVVHNCKIGWYFAGENEWHQRMPIGVFALCAIRLLKLTLGWNPIKGIFS